MREEDKKQMMEEIAYFFREEFDLDLGIIGQENVLEFFQSILGKKIYNEALEEAQKFYKRQFENMESDFYALYKE